MPTDPREQVADVVAHVQRPPAPSVRGAQVPEAARHCEAEETPYSQGVSREAYEAAHAELLRHYGHGHALYRALVAAVPVLLSEQQQRIEAAMEALAVEIEGHHEAGAGDPGYHGGIDTAAWVVRQSDLAIRAVLGSSEQGDKK